MQIVDDYTAYILLSRGLVPVTYKANSVALTGLVTKAKALQKQIQALQDQLEDINAEILDRQIAQLTAKHAHEIKSGQSLF